MRKFLWIFLALPLVAQVSPPSTQSRVAGRFVAWNYGQWSLPIYSFPSGIGSKTFTLTNPTVTLSDGRKIMPFNTNAQVIVGTETVTLTAVGSGCIIGASAPGGCSLTATFSNAHTNADQVRSATFGLQEALNDAGSSGGGVVTVDSAWANLGGTTGIVNAATLPSNTAIEDVRTGTPSVPAQYKTWSCQPGLGDGTNAITAATYPQSTCRNETGVTITITGIRCFTDNNGTTTLAVSDSASNNLLTGPITCSSSWAAGTQSANVTLTSGRWLVFSLIADGTSKQATFDVHGTY